MRVRSALVLVLMAAVAAPPPLAVAATCDGVTNGRVVKRGDRWSELRPAPFVDDSGTTDVVDWTVSVERPQQLYVTNGVTVQRTRDGGCFWDVVFRDRLEIPDLLQTVKPAYTRVVDLATAGQNALWLLLEDRTLPVPRADVAMSPDGGGSFRRGGSGLPPEGAAHLLAAAANGMTAYVTIRAANGTVDDQMFRTADGGVSWEARGAPLTGLLTKGLLVDPANESELWLWDAEGLLHSTDSGATFDRVDGVASPLASLAMSARGVLMGAYAEESALAVSRNGGESWEAKAWGGRTTAVALPTPMLDLLMPGTVATAGPSGAQLEMGGRRQKLGLAGVPLAGLAIGAPRDRKFPVFVGTPGGVFRYEVTVTGQEPPPPTKYPPVELDPAAAVRLGRSALVPPTQTIDLRPGQSRRVRYRLELPPVPSPLDVYFLIDTTGSMGSTIAGLRRGIGRIVNDLSAVGIGAHFGVADFQDYPVAPWGTPGDVPYRRHRAIGPPDDELREAIEALQLGGGGDGPESDLPALYQSVTGAGQRFVGAPAEDPIVIPPNQQAGFRPDALKVIVLATDVEFHEEPGYPGPTMDTTVDALRRHGVRVVGLSIGSGPGDEGGGFDDMVQVAEATDAFAPAAGVDCEGDGDVDLQDGAPLVCPLVANSQEINLAPAIVGILRSLRDEARVELGVNVSGSVARVVGRSAYDGVNVRARNTLPFDVEFTCPAGSEGFDEQVRVQGVSRNEVLAVANAHVRCTPPVPRRPAPPFDPPAPPPIVAAAIAPPPAPQQPVRLEQNLNPQNNPNPQAQVHTSGAVAAAEQEQPQLALAHDTVPDGEEELAMVGLPREVQGPAELMMAALALAAAAGVVMARTRTATRLATARARSGRR